jgi:hypothetical protein
MDSEFYDPDEVLTAMLVWECFALPSMYLADSVPTDIPFAPLEVIVPNVTAPPDVAEAKMGVTTNLSQALSTVQGQSALHPIESTVPSAQRMSRSTHEEDKGHVTRQKGSALTEEMIQMPTVIGAASEFDERIAASVRDVLKDVIEKVIQASAADVGDDASAPSTSHGAMHNHTGHKHEADHKDVDNAEGAEVGDADTKAESKMMTMTESVSGSTEAGSKSARNEESDGDEKAVRDVLNDIIEKVIQASAADVGDDASAPSTSHGAMHSHTDHKHEAGQKDVDNAEGAEVGNADAKAESKMMTMTETVVSSKDAASHTDEKAVRDVLKDVIEKVIQASAADVGDGANAPSTSHDAMHNHTGHKHEADHKDVDNAEGAEVGNADTKAESKMMTMTEPVDGSKAATSEAGSKSARNEESDGDESKHAKEEYYTIPKESVSRKTNRDKIHSDANLDTGIHTQTVEESTIAHHEHEREHEYEQDAGCCEVPEPPEVLYHTPWLSHTDRKRFRKRVKTVFAALATDSMYVDHEQKLGETELANMVMFASDFGYLMSLLLSHAYRDMQRCRRVSDRCDVSFDVRCEDGSCWWQHVLVSIAEKNALKLEFCVALLYFSY